MNNRLEAQDVIREVLDKIVAGYAPQKVILFGSYAHGTPNEDSDLDLLIIKETDQRPLQRWIEVKRLVRDRNRMVSVSPLIYTPQELAERLTMKDFFIEEILEKGQVLYG